MAEAAPTQESGGGEGVLSATISDTSSQEAKPIESVIEQLKKEVGLLTGETPSVPELTAVEVPVVSETATQPDTKVEPVQPESKVEQIQPETKVEQTQPDSKVEQTQPDSKVEIPQPETKVEPIQPESIVEQTNGVPKEGGDWQQREAELLKKIEELEKVKTARTEDSLRLELKIREEEIDLLKARVRNLETELQAALSKPSGKNHEMIENIKQQHEELLSKARGMIFDKTKMVKNQELQIEALTTQVQSLKDINVITKDLLEIRNSEVKAMEERFQAMEARYKTEKERYGLVLQRAQTSTNINDDLRKEYETQLAIFKELREKYEQKVQALVSENAQLKALNEARKAAAAAAASGK